MTQVLRAQNKEQKNLIRAILENDIIIVKGCPGSGKTFLTSLFAAEKLAHNEIQKIIFSKPLVGTGKGFPPVPGDLEEKTLIYRYQQEIYFSDYFGAKEYKKRKEDNTIQFIPLELMRGINLGKENEVHWCLLDEAQNAGTKELKCLFTRLGENAKIIVNGDTRQTDLKTGPDFDCDLDYVIDKIGHLDRVAVVELVQSFRNPLVTQIEKLL